MNNYCVRTYCNSFHTLESVRDVVPYHFPPSSPIGTILTRDNSLCPGSWMSSATPTTATRAGARRMTRSPTTTPSSRRTWRTQSCDTRLHPPRSRQRPRLHPRHARPTPRQTAPARPNNRPTDSSFLATTQRLYYIITLSTLYFVNVYGLLNRNFYWIWCLQIKKDGR